MRFCNSADDANPEDLRDAGTDVVDILAGRAIPLRMGYIPMVNRPWPAFHRRSKLIRQALDAEHNFVEQYPAYQGKGQCCGTPFLSRKLSMVCARSQMMIKLFDAGGLLRSLCTTFAQRFQISSNASPHNYKSTTPSFSRSADHSARHSSSIDAKHKHRIHERVPQGYRR